MARGPYIRRENIHFSPPGYFVPIEKAKRGRPPIDDSEYISKALAGSFRTANEAAYSLAQNAVDFIKEPVEYNRLYCRLKTKLKAYY